METGFLSLHDEHFAALPSPLYDQDILDDSDSSLLDIIQKDFPYEVGVNRNFDQPDFWGTEQELNGDMAVLPLAMPLDGNVPHSKEDFQKMLSDWQEHLGSLQASDTEDMDVKDIVGLDMVMPKNVSEQLPDDIFENDAPSLTPSSKVASPVKMEPPSLQQNKRTSALGISIKTELNLDNFMECEEEDDDEPGLTVDDSTYVNLANVKIEIEEDCIDVETVSEQIPVLEAGDLKSLLEQFEASEAFNPSSSPKPKPSVLDTHLYAMATQQVPAVPTNTHQNIKDSLPQEVIDRIKASGRKKVIPVIPAMPTRRPGRSGTRMQDAGATLSRNKLLKIVSANGSGESVQLDHDYCSFSSNDVELAPPPRSFYHTDASEYTQDNNKKPQEVGKVYSRLPDYYTVLAPQKIGDRNARDDESWGESSSKKDSGLESGEVSDASEESNAKTCSNVVSVNGKEYHIASGNKTVNIKPSKEMPMISVLKKCQLVTAPNSGGAPAVSEVVKEEQQGPKKRKLNLQEYRSRLKELDRIRGSKDNSPASSSVSVGTSMTEEGGESSAVAEQSVVPIRNVDSVARPVMQSVEVQTLPQDEVSATRTDDEKEKTESNKRDRRRRQYRSRRATSSSSSGSSSSRSSRRSRRRDSSRSKNRRKPSWRRNAGFLLNNSSTSRSHSSWSRSPSSSSNKSTCSSRSSSRSSGGKSSHRSRSGSSSRWRHQYDRHNRDFRSHGWRRSRSPIRGIRKMSGDWQLTEREKQRQVEERRVIYVGRIEEGTTKAELRQRFEMFGPIVDISVHFREHGDNYGFVTFQYKVDAYEAVEHGNDNPSLPHYDLCFGGRRAFCKTRYADLDGMATKSDPLGNCVGFVRAAPPHVPRTRTQNEDFDMLLREAQATLRKRKA